jgi:hypothetical protein
MYNELSYPHLVGGYGMDAILMQRKNLMNFFKNLFLTFSEWSFNWFLCKIIDIKVLP